VRDVSEENLHPGARVERGLLDECAAVIEKHASWSRALSVVHRFAINVK
jgi:hypothetical protein